MSIDPGVTFPLHIGVNWLMYKPQTELLPSSHPCSTESADMPGVSAQPEILANDDRS